MVMVQLLKIQQQAIFNLFADMNVKKPQKLNENKGHAPRLVEITWVVDFCRLFVEFAYFLAVCFVKPVYADKYYCITHRID